MTIEQGLLGAAGVSAFLIYGHGVVLAAIAYVHADNGKDETDALWWPIHIAKALLKSLYRALFTGWKL